MKDLNFEFAQAPKSDPLAAMRQVGDLLQQTLPLYVDMNSGLSGFTSRPKSKDPASGIQSVTGELDADVIRIRLQLVHASTDIRIDAGSFFKELGQLSEKTRLISQQDNADAGLYTELRVQAVPMSLTRSAAFLEEIKHIHSLAQALQRQLPDLKSFADFKKTYAAFAGSLEPVYPWQHNSGLAGSEFTTWCLLNLDLLSSGCAAALESPYPVCVQYSLACMADAYKKRGGSIGRVMMTGINARGLLDLTEKAPDIIALPATSLSIGSNPYEMGHEIQNLLKYTADAGRGLVVFGSQSELQSVFQGGQGGSPHPLLPVVRHVPELSLDVLLRYELYRAARQRGGLSRAALDEHHKALHSVLDKLPQSAQRQLLPVTVKHRLVNGSNGFLPGQDLKGFISTLDGFSETLSGLSQKPRSGRMAQVSARFLRGLTGDGLFTHLQEHLLAQDNALYALTDRLQSECLTRPDHQPLCYCAQGTPATGKSQSAKMIAAYLGIPYVNIDAASIPDFYTASAQLLGSGRGIVNSYQAGRLEQAAKHHTGVLIEISDLDHAKAQVRTALADLFLQALDNGEAQSATGGMFSVANCIFAFTINLPEGMDVTIRKSIGFGEGPSQDQILKDVSDAVTHLFSSAFVSRVGTPILFDPLNGDQVGEIVERGIRESALISASRLQLPVVQVKVRKGVGKKVLNTLKMSFASTGARKLLEQARQLTAAAMLDYSARPQEPQSDTLVISSKTGKTLNIQPERRKQDHGK